MVRKDCSGLVELMVVCSASLIKLHSGGPAPIPCQPVFADVHGILMEFHLFHLENVFACLGLVSVMM